MKSDRFDAFARTLPLVLPRRLAVGGALGATLAALLVGGAEAKNKKRKKKRRKKKCKKTCSSSNLCEAASCNKKGKCEITDQPDGLACGAEQGCCGGQCLDLADDPENCGTCDVVCPSGECVEGACTCDPPNNVGCPEGCDFCFNRLNAQQICAAGSDPLAGCASDDDCPEFGSFCVDNNFITECSIPCGG